MIPWQYKEPFYRRLYQIFPGTSFHNALILGAGSGSDVSTALAYGVHSITAVEIDPTILSQCNTVFALRMSNDRYQEIVKSAIADTGSGLLEFLTALGQREAIAFGDGVTLPVRIKFDELPADCMPRSSSARFTEKWQKSVTDDGFLDSIVERWRNSSSASAALAPP